MYDTAVIVPTCGLLSTIPVCVQTMFATVPECTLFVFSINPFDKEEAKEAMEAVKRTAKVVELEQGKKINFIELIIDKCHKPKSLY